MTVVAQPVTATRRSGPVGTNERIHALDIIRGFALFGMVLVHFHQKMRADTAGIEDLIPWGVWILVEQKAWGTFALLFGAGFAILLRRLEARGRRDADLRATSRHARGRRHRRRGGLRFPHPVRVRVLLVLLVVRRWPDRALLALAIGAAAARPAVAIFRPLPANLATQVAGLSRAVDLAAAQGSYTALLSARWALFVASFPPGWRGLLPDANLALFILGLLAVRNGVFDKPLRHVRLIAGWMTFGFVSWALAWIAPIESGLGIIDDQWLCFTYVGGMVLLIAYHPQWVSRLALVGFAGRMALTNYLVQAIALDVLSSGYGAHLKLRPYAYLGAAVCLFGGEALASRLWLTRFSYGPLERIWRSATYATFRP